MPSPPPCRQSFPQTQNEWVPRAAALGGGPGGRASWRGLGAKPRLFLLLLAAAAPPPGAASCSGCHGAALPLTGRTAQDMTETLTAFRSGAREATVMGRIAKGFDASELKAIAAWWAAQK